MSRREGGLRLGPHAGSDLGELVPNETAGPADGPDAWEEKKVGTEAEEYHLLRWERWVWGRRLGGQQQK